MKIHRGDVDIEIEAADGVLFETLSGSDLLSEDIIFFSGEIRSFTDRLFKDKVLSKGERKNVTLVLTTPGGDADAAYKIARMLQDAYDRFRLIVPAECKSAGTLLALGANEIVMDPFGELGPLDVQVFNPDEFIHRTSGLSIAQALSFISEKAFEVWEDSFINVRIRSMGNITTTTASEIASELAVGLFSPITDKIDPSRLGELQRSIDVALQYGKRLGAETECIKSLIEGYPSHSFVIDYIEAKTLFNHVRLVSPAESVLLSLIQQCCEENFGADFVHDLSVESALLRFNLKIKDDGEYSDENDDQEPSDPTSNADVNSDENEGGSDGGATEENENDTGS